MFKNLDSITKNYFVIIIITVLLISVFFIPFLNNTNIVLSPDTENTFTQIISSNDICWPLPGYTRISSPFGYRGAPTAGATNFHGGIDLPAPPGTNIISAISGRVTKTGFMGSGGCSVVVENERYTIIFHHVNPSYLVYPGEYVQQGQIIAQVGPKNVYGFSNNPYIDANRKPNKWSNNWAPFTFHSKKRIEIHRSYVSILNFKNLFSYISSSSSSSIKFISSPNSSKKEPPHFEPQPEQ